MIKIHSYQNPIVWQVDRQYLLPSQSGQVRWNGNLKMFEVCDNSSGAWYKIDNSVELSCDPQTQQILEWAKKKMVEDERVEKLAKEYPAVKDLKEKLDIVIKLVEKENANRDG
jgi:hypothetical protein